MKHHKNTVTVNNVQSKKLHKLCDITWSTAVKAYTTFTFAEVSVTKVSVSAKVTDVEVRVLQHSQCQGTIQVGPHLHPVGGA